MDAFFALLPLASSLIYFGAALAVTCDAVLHKRNVRAAIGWIGMAWLAPFLGAAFYLVFGINRIQRSGASLGLLDAWKGSPDTEVTETTSIAESGFAVSHPHFIGMDRLAERVSRRPLSSGNSIELLRDGDAAFPAMLAAIDRAKKSVTLQTYIFDVDEVGSAFRDALVRAHARGVAVRVLIDGLGARYSKSSMVAELKRAGIRAASFLPTVVPRLFRYSNMRNHRKIMVVDGELGFTGGTNIRAGHWLSRNPRHPVRCLHFSVRGPAVADMQRTLATDWAFATGEQLLGEPWFSRLSPCGSVLARGIPDGPDTDLDNMPKVMLGALAAAQSRVRIVSPYFLPDEALSSAIKVAALRGVKVDIVIPEKTNFSVMDWAMRPQLIDLLENGCRAYLSAPPFDHSKLFTADGVWSLIGSTNWDSRSLRLNFEYDLECYDTELTRELDEVADERIAGSHQVQLSELYALPLSVRLRDGTARLLTPYV
ncbi:MAG: phospholipase D-like domain-containing protein [Treponemataceae bacterium]